MFVSNINVKTAEPIGPKLWQFIGGIKKNLVTEGVRKHVEDKMKRMIMNFLLVLKFIV